MTDPFAAPRQARSNSYLRAAASDADGPAATFPKAPVVLFSRLAALIEADPAYTDVRADPSAMTLYAVAVTKLMRFKDDVSARVEAAGEGKGSQLSLYSRSRLGKSDLGANKKRVEALIAALRN